jgi:hypothetical protein
MTTKMKSKTKKSTSKKAVAKPKTKLAIIQNLIERPKGASIVELTRATKWQAHSVRAAITGLRKKGRAVVCTKNADGVARYFIAEDNSGKVAPAGSRK